ncbi:MAG: ROK family transcriptional regulator [Anaerolineae bacterium]
MAREIGHRHQTAILQALKDGQLKTRSQIAEETGLSLSTIGRIVEGMIERKLIQEISQDSSSVGRPPALLQVNPDLGFVVGLDIGAGTIRAVAIDLLGNIISSFDQKTGVYKGNEELLQEMIGLTGKIINRAGLGIERILGLGVAISGIVDSEAGVCLFCPNIPGPKDTPIKERLEKEFPFKIFVDDQARTHALAEKRYGVAKGVENFIHVSVGIGLGAGICMNDQVYRGENGLAGELGHITVKEDGPLCSCGNKGCLEALASGPAIVRRAREGLQEGVYSSLTSVMESHPEKLTVEAIAQAAEAGDKLAFQIIDRTGQYLGIGIATALNLLGSQLVVIGGGVANCGDILLEAIERTVKLRALHVVSPRIKIKRTALDDRAAALGAAAAVVDHIFSSPPEEILSKR